MASRWLIGAIFLGVALVAAGLLTGGNSSPQDERSPAATTAQKSAAPSTASATKRRSVPDAVHVSSSAPTRSTPWDDFERKFGTGFTPEYSADGRLISIHGIGTSPDHYDTRDPQAAIARAREILEASRGLLGLKDGLPLENPRVITSGASAQISFHEELNGTPLAPFGEVDITLGSQGELVGLDSSYQPNVTAASDGLSSADDFRAQALAASHVTGANVDGGSKVLWTKTSLATEGVYAYQYWVRGRQIVIDASNGDVLFNRDRRSF